MQSPKSTSAVIASLVIAVAAGVGYVVHKEAKARSEARAAEAAVREATAQLMGLKSVSPDALQKIEANMRTAKTWGNAELADATEHYLIGTREILRRRAEANRLQQKAAASRAALAAHMARAGGRDTAWIRTASSLKKQVERDHFDLEMMLNALADLIEGLPEANKRLAPHVEASLLLDDRSRERARLAVVQETRRASAELASVRNILPR